MKKILLAVGMVIQSGILVLAQISEYNELNLNIYKTNAVFVSKEFSHLPHVECYMAVNPEDEMNLAVASMAVTEKGELSTVVFISVNGGLTWKRTLAAGEGCSDPWIAFGKNDHLFFSTLCTVKDAKIRIYHSADKGLTWTNPSLIPVADTNHRSFDHPSLAVDISTNKIYVLASHVVRSPATNETGNRSRFTIAISSSEDNGRTFSIPLVVSPSNLKYQAGNIVVLPGNKAVFSFFDFASPDWNSLLGVRTLWSVSSDGNTISRPSFVVQYSDFRNLTHLAVDISGKEFNNRIYSVFANYGGKIEPYDQDDNEAEILWPNRGIYLANSLDSGKTWSVPQIIEKSGNMFSARYCNVAVNSHGTVAVAWMEAEDSTKKCFVPYMVVSKDGGKNVSKKIKVSDKVKCMIPDKEVNTMGKVNAAGRFQIGGDYFGLSGGPDDSFYMSWSEPELKTSRLQLWMSKLTVEKKK